MAKAGELWDESALINAFDNAMSKYKVMHSNSNDESSNEVREVMSSTGKNLPSLVEEGYEAKRHLEAVDNNNDASDFTREIVECTDPSSTKENLCVESCAPQCHMDVSNSLITEDAVNAHSNSQSDEDYTQLLNQYYELEEKRQQIIWQLHQFGYGNYQHSDENSGAVLQCDQDHQVPVNQVSNSMVACSCCPNSSHCTAPPSTSLRVCSLAGTCSGNASTDASLAKGPEKTFSLKIDDTFTTAMEAAKRAISSLKMNNSERENDEGHHESKLVGDTSSETDLTDVLNAWYSAGFFTARYLMEQSAKKGHG